MVAVIGLHRLADLAHLQSGTGGDKLGHQGGGAVHQRAGGQEGVAVGLEQLPGGLVPAVVALLVHGGVKGGNGVGGGGDLGIEGVGLFLGGRLLLVGGGGAVLMGGEGNENVLAVVDALRVDHVLDILVGGGELAGLLHGALQVLHLIIGVVEGQVALPGDTLLVQPLLHGQAVVHLIHTAHLLQLLLGLGPLLLGDGGPRRFGVVGHRGVQLADILGILLEVVGGGGALDLLLPGGVVGQIACVLGIGDAGQQPVQILVGGDVPAVHGEEHRVPGQAGGLIGDIIGGGGGAGLGIGGAASGQSAGEKRAAETSAQEFFPIHVLFLLAAGHSRPNRV